VRKKLADLGPNPKAQCYDVLMVRLTVMLDARNKDSSVVSNCSLAQLGEVMAAMFIIV
jgi:hypothetical protein